MIAKEIDVKGLDYTIEGVDSDFLDQEFYTPDIEDGHDYLPDFSNEMRCLHTYPERDKLTFTHRNKGKYTVHAWSDGKVLLTDPSDTVWIYDSDEDVTAYQGEGEFVAAYNPDISDVWEDIISGEWMKDFIDRHERDLGGGFNRLHPELGKRVARGLDLRE